MAKGWKDLDPRSRWSHPSPAGRTRSRWWRHVRCSIDTSIVNSIVHSILNPLLNSAASSICGSTANTIVVNSSLDAIVHSVVDY